MNWTEIRREAEVLRLAFADYLQTPPENRREARDELSGRLFALVGTLCEKLEPRSAEDIVSDATERAMSTLEGGTWFPDELLAWLKVVVKRKAVDQARKNHRWDITCPLPEGLIDPRDPVDAIAHNREAVDKVLLRLHRPRVQAPGQPLPLTEEEKFDAIEERRIALGLSPTEFHMMARRLHNS